MNNIYFYLGFLIIPFIGLVAILIMLFYANSRQENSLLKMIEISTEWLKK